MAGSVAEAEDFVVDMVLEVDSRGIGVEELSRRICLPGMEILRTTDSGTIWLTALVTAQGDAQAIAQVRSSVLAQLPDRPRAVAAAVVSSVPLGDLYARLQTVLADDELDELDGLDIRDLVAQTLPDRPARREDPALVDLRAVDLRLRAGRSGIAEGQLSSSA
jgi:hypothetical protein